MGSNMFLIRAKRRDVMIRDGGKKSGKTIKLSRQWHGPIDWLPIGVTVSGDVDIEVKEIKTEQELEALLANPSTQEEKPAEKPSRKKKHE